MLSEYLSYPAADNCIEDIELRVMVDEDTSNEDIPLDIIELYIR